MNWWDDPVRRRWAGRGGWLLVFLFLFALSIEDWGRDLTTTHAQTSETADDVDLRPLERRESVDDLATAIRWAGEQRVRNWEFIGQTSDDDTTVLLFERTHRWLRCKDDIQITIEDLGDRRLVTGHSASRIRFIGDLGRNPANLRRIRLETLNILDGSVLGRLATEYGVSR